MIFLDEDASNVEFMRRWEKGDVFALVTTFDGNKKLSENLKNNIILRKYIKKQGYDCLKVQGRYEEDDSRFESMIVFLGDKDKKEFIRFLMFFCRKYEQGYFILVDEKTDIWEVGTSMKSVTGGIGKWRKHDRFHYRELFELIEYFSRKTYVSDKIRVITD